MILLSLELKNFKCHKHQFWDFGTGVTCIMGANGAGKSSIIQAISWVLFGQIPYKTATSLIRKGAKLTEVYLNIKSSRDGNIYRLEKSISNNKKSSTSAQIRDISNGMVVVEGVTAYEEWIRYHLNISDNIKLSTLADSCIAVPQGKLSGDFLETPAKRKVTFDALLGLDEYKAIDTKLAEAYKHLNNHTQRLKGNIDSQSSLNTEIEDIQAQIKTIDIEISQSQQTLIEINTKISPIETAYRKAIADQQQYKLWSEKIESIQKEAESIKEQLEEATNASQKVQELDEIATQYVKYKQEKEELENNLRIYQGIIREKAIAETEYKNTEAQLNNIQKTITNIQDIKKSLPSLEASSKEYTALQQEYQLFNVTIDQQKQQIQNLPKLQQEYREYQSEIQNLQEKIQKYEDNKHVLSQEDSINEQLANLLTEHNTTLNIEKRLQEYTVIPTDTAQNIQAKVQVIESEINIQKQKIQTLQAEIKINTEMGPKLVQDGICPVFAVECLNLKQNNINNISVSIENDIKIKKNNISDIEKSLQIQQNELNILKKDLEVASAYERLQEELNGRNSNIIREQGKKLREQEILIREIKQIAESIDAYQQKLSTIQQKSIDLHKIISDISNIDITSIENNMQELLSKISATESMHHEYISSKKILENELNIQKEYDEISQKVLILGKTIADFAARLTDFQDIDSKLSSMQEFLGENEQRYHEWILSAEMAKKQMGLIEKHKSLTKDIENIQKNLNDIKIYDEEWYTQQQNTIQSLRIEQKEIEQNIHTSQEVKNIQVKSLKAYEGKNEQLQKNKDKCKKYEAKLGHIETLREVYKKISVKLAGSYTEYISKYADNVFIDIVGDASFRIEWDESYAIQANRYGEYISLEQLSGGEQTIASIAVRVALLQALTNISFACFDEPTAHLDTVRKQALAQQISHISHIQQLFVITHDESFVGQTDNVITLGEI